jgi:predicted membrane chloride channel (bestrophin family)
MGMELLYVEIDDPFAEDPNDLPLTEEARAAGVDVFLSFWQVDGREAAERLRQHFCFPSSYIPREHLGANETDPLV